MWHICFTGLSGAGRFLLFVRDDPGRTMQNADIRYIPTGWSGDNLQEMDPVSLSDRTDHSFFV
jgi:hypothetical protein